MDPVGTTLQASLGALRPEGRLVFVGNAGGAQLIIDPWPALQVNQSLLGVFMGAQLEKTDVHLTISRMLGLAARGQIKVIVDRAFPLAAAAEAHAYSEENDVYRRVVIIPSQA